MFSKCGCTCGLHMQERTGEGQLVDACLLRSGIFSMGAQMSMVLNLISRDPPVMTKVHGRDGQFRFRLFLFRSFSVFVGTLFYHLSLLFSL